MSLPWGLSVDDLVIALITVCMCGLAIAWLLVGRKPSKPQKTSKLETMRLAGREAEPCFEPVAPPVTLTGAPPEKTDEGVREDVVTASPPPEEPPKPEEMAPERLLMLVQSETPKTEEQKSAISIAAALVRHDKRPPTERPQSGAAPVLEAAPASSSHGDDLTRIKGVDADLAAKLNEQGVNYFDQVATWSPDYMAWIATRIGKAHGDIAAEHWIDQAKELAAENAGPPLDRVSERR